VIHRRGPWRSFEAVEFATLEWVDWFNNRRLLEPIGNIPPAEVRTTLLRHAGNNRPWRHNLNQMASGKPGAVHIADGDYKGQLALRIPADWPIQSAVWIPECDLRPVP